MWHFEVIRRNLGAQRSSAQARGSETVSQANARRMSSNLLEAAELEGDRISNKGNSKYKAVETWGHMLGR